MRAVDFSERESLMMSCTDDKTIKLWSLLQCTFQKSLLRHVDKEKRVTILEEPLSKF